MAQITGEFDRFGVPPQGVLDARPVAPGERVVFVDVDEVAEAEALADLDVLTRREAGSWLNPLNWLRGPAATAAVVVLVGTLVLLVTSQVVGVLASVQTLPPMGQYAVYGVMGLALAAIAYALARLLLAFARFKATPRYSFAALRELSHRAELRETARTNLDRAIGDLADILREYPASTDEDRARLVRLGFKPDEADRLGQARDRLLGELGDISPSAWIERYRTLFAAPLDEAARRLVRRRALLVGAKTAAVPHGALDTAILLAHAYLMIADLCTLYRVRTNRAGTIALTWRILVAAFIAGRLDDLADEAAGHFAQLATQATSGTLAKAGTAVAGKVIGKAAEGVVNATFAYRLGRAAMVRLRPLD